MRTNTTRELRVRLAASALALAGVVVGGEGAGAINDRTHAVVSRTVASVTVDHPQPAPQVGHLRGRHLRIRHLRTAHTHTVPATTSSSFGGGGGPIRYR